MAADSRPCLGDARAWPRPKQEQTVELGNRRTFHADARRNQATTGFSRTANSRKSPSSRSRSGGRKRPHAPRRASGRVGLSRHSWPFCPYLSPNSHISTRDAFTQFAWVHGQRTTGRRQRHCATSNSHLQLTHHPSPSTSHLQLILPLDPDDKGALEESSGAPLSALQSADARLTSSQSAPRRPEGFCLRGTRATRRRPSRHGSSRPPCRSS